MLKDFREFAMRGNVVDVAVGIIIGAAFGTIVRSLVDDVLMPPLGLVMGGVDFTNLFIILKQGVPPGPYLSLADARAAGAVSINYGLFVNTVIGFLIVSLAVFLLIRTVNAMRRGKKAGAPDATMKECQYCVSSIPLRATRCPQCTATLAA